MPAAPTSTETLLSQGRSVRQVAFSDVGAAFKFAGDFLATAQARSEGSLGPFPHHSFPHYMFENLVEQHNGRLTATSSTRARERKVFQRQAIVYQQDRDYLFDRDPTAEFLISKAPEACWWKLPRTYDAEIDGFIRKLRNLGFNPKAEAADIKQRTHGWSLLFIVAPGDKGTPLPRNRPWAGFDYIDAPAIVPESIVYDTSGDPLLKQHGILSLEVLRADGERELVHGSRFRLFREDLLAREVPGGRSMLDVVYDDLWSLRDVLFAQEQAQVQGDPIVVSVDLEHNYTVNPETQADIEAESKEMKSGHRQAFSPTEGLIIERLGSVSLDDPTHIIRTLYSRIANGTRNFYPINMIVASSRGSEQVTDQDRMDFASNVVMRNEKFVLPILTDLLDLAKHSGMVSRSAEFPEDVEWPDLRVLNPRERAYVESTKATALLRAQQSGYLPDKWVMKGMSPRPGGILPLQPSHPSDADLERERMEFEGEEADKDREHESEEGDKDRSSKEKVAKSKPKPSKSGGSK